MHHETVFNFYLCEVAQSQKVFNLGSFGISFSVTGYMAGPPNLGETWYEFGFGLGLVNNSVNCSSVLRPREYIL